MQRAFSPGVKKAAVYAHSKAALKLTANANAPSSFSESLFAGHRQAVCKTISDAWQRTYGFLQICPVTVLLQVCFRDFFRRH
jgi:hypothetical protein